MARAPLQKVGHSEAIAHRVPFTVLSFYTQSVLGLETILFLNHNE